MQRLRMLLDANVLVDAQLRDLFLRLDEADVIEVRWSAEIMAEMHRVLTDKLGPARHHRPAPQRDDA